MGRDWHPAHYDKFHFVFVLIQCILLSAQLVIYQPLKVTAQLNIWTQNELLQMRTMKCQMNFKSIEK